MFVTSNTNETRVVRHLLRVPLMASDGELMQQQLESVRASETRHKTITTCGHISHVTTLCTVHV